MAVTKILCGVVDSRRHRTALNQPRAAMCFREPRLEKWPSERECTMNQPAHLLRRLKFSQSGSRGFLRFVCIAGFAG
ncbi:hypothetical protein J7I98_21785 [Streptomyces sp. ISL-98]|uniref:hypothetical protein n=1 Tax=Streptomyces sp. ISL-98 TaxID=2819192 RepID=UPI001BE5063E|nr:hypothetical protein [Streptomyces sp. ISL-98]MBT2508471.1 hypothetical protein [Streptomyces sp. ISL-98]